MKSNVGTVDKTIRILLAIVLVTLYFTDTLTDKVGYIALALAGVLVVTSLVSFCPLYALVGLNTCPTKKA